MCGLLESAVFVEVDVWNFLRASVSAPNRAGGRDRDSGLWRRPSELGKPLEGSVKDGRLQHALSCTTFTGISNCVSEWHLASNEVKVRIRLNVIHCVAGCREGGMTPVGNSKVESPSRLPHDIRRKSILPLKTPCEPGHTVLPPESLLVDLGIEGNDTAPEPVSTTLFASLLLDDAGGRSGETEHVELDNFVRRVWVGHRDGVPLSIAPSIR